jgi:hypothetical protein
VSFASGGYGLRHVQEFRLHTPVHWRAVCAQTSRHVRLASSLFRIELAGITTEPFAATAFAAEPVAADAVAEADGIAVALGARGVSGTIAFDEAAGTSALGKAAGAGIGGAAGVSEAVGDGALALSRLVTTPPIPAATSNATAAPAIWRARVEVEALAATEIAAVAG